MGKPIRVKSGDAYGRLSVVKEVNQKGNGRRFLCKCECGNFKEINFAKLRSGNTKSCGCLRGKASITHGMSRTRLYTIYNDMKSRCNNPNNPLYKHYGKRGIRVTDEWSIFENFNEWAMSNGYKEDLTLDRINVNEDYSPLNCRWATMSQQNKNKRNTYYVEFNGESKPLKEWCETLGLGYTKVWKRIDRGWSIEDALTLGHGQSPSDAQ